MPVAPRPRAHPSPPLNQAPGRGGRRLTSLAFVACLTLSAFGCGATLTNQPSPLAAASTPSASLRGTATLAPPATPWTATSAGPHGPASATNAASTLAVPTPVPSGRIALRGTSQTFASLRYGYDLTVGATDWVVRETPGTWNGVFDPRRLNPDPGTDWFRHPGVATIQVGVLVVSPGTMVGAWETSEAPAVQMLDCTESAHVDSVAVAGEQALLLPETCAAKVVGEGPGDQFVLNAFLVHGANGFVFRWSSHPGREHADRASFLGILATLTWASD